MRINKILLTLALAINYISVASQSYESENKELDKFIKQGIKDWKVPGMAVTVVKRGEVVFEKVCGVIDVETNTPVNKQTLFSNASTTKAMVALALGMLVDEEKLDWQDPVTDYLPYFKLSDPYITSEARVIDLLTHNLGIGRTDGLWVIDSMSVEETINKLQYAPIKYSLRSSYAYQNIMYAAAGEVIKAVSGLKWHEFVRKRIFQPLGMSSVPLFKELLERDNYTAPHWLEEDGKTVRKIDYMYSDQIGAAGMVWSSIEDMSKWVIFLLDSGQFEQDTLISRKSYSELFKPQTLVPNDEFYPSQKLTKPNWTSYGLGWFQQDYKGKMINFHTGSLAGLVAICGLMQEEGLGLFVFANLSGAELRHAIMFKVFDLYALGGDRDWNREIYDLYKEAKAKAEAKVAKEDSLRVTGSEPTISIDNFIGEYENVMYGVFKISMNENDLYIKLNELYREKIQHWHYNTFRISSTKPWLDKGTIHFNINSKGKVGELIYRDMRFTRKE